MTLDALGIAKLEDADAIARLVNAAYRPRSGAAGWTHERELISGPRIDAARLAAAIAQAGSVILIDSSAAGVDACVQLQPRGDVCLLGLLAVDPARQGTGVGASLLARAERYAAVAWACSTIRISVLSQRSELLVFYRRRGYRATGTVSDYPIALGVGAPIIEGLTIDTLEKPLAR